jgi:hypothetical protein
LLSEVFPGILEVFGIRTMPHHSHGVNLTEPDFKANG